MLLKRRPEQSNSNTNDEHEPYCDLIWVILTDMNGNNQESSVWHKVIRSTRLIFSSITLEKGFKNSASGSDVRASTPKSAYAMMMTSWGGGGGDF